MKSTGGRIEINFLKRESEGKFYSVVLFFALLKKRDDSAKVISEMRLKSIKEQVNQLIAKLKTITEEINKLYQKGNAKN